MLRSLPSGDVQLLRGQEEVSRWSKNACFCPRSGLEMTKWRYLGDQNEKNSVHVVMSLLDDKWARKKEIVSCGRLCTIKWDKSLSEGAFLFLPYMDYVFYVLSKGRLISKAIYGLLTSPKKWTNEFDLFAILLFTANKSNYSVRFLRESTARQSSFWFHLTFNKTYFVK